MMQKTPETALKPVKQTFGSPATFGLNAAVKMLDVDMVRRILKDHGDNIILNKDNLIVQALNIMMRKITFSEMEQEITPSLFGDNLSNGLTILEMLLKFLDLPKTFIDFEYLVFLKIIHTNNKTRQALELEIEQIIAYLKSIKQTCKAGDNCSGDTCNDNNYTAFEFETLIRLNLLSMHFQMDSAAEKKAAQAFLNVVIHKKRLKNCAKEVFSLHSLCNQFSEAVSESNFEAIQKTAHRHYINALVRDEEGTLRSPLFHALRAGRNDIADWLCHNKDYYPLLYPDWLLIEGLPQDFIEQVLRITDEQYRERRRQESERWERDKQLNSNIKGIESVLNIRLISYFCIYSDILLTSSGKKFPFERFMADILLDLIRCENVPHRQQKLDIVRTTHIDKLSRIIGIALTVFPLERISEKVSHKLFSRPSSHPFNFEISKYGKEMSLDEFKLVILYIVLFVDHSLLPADMATREKLDALKINEEHYLEKLSAISGDLLVILLQKHNGAEYGIKVWDEVYQRSKLRGCRALWPQVQVHFSDEIIQKNINDVIRQDKYSIPAFFTYFRLSDGTVFARLPKEVLDRISFFINPNIKRRSSVNSISPTIDRSIFVDLPIHQAIENGDYITFEKECHENPGLIEVRDSDGLTPLMLCLKEMRKKREENNKLSDSLKARINKIFTFCLKNYADPNIGSSVTFDGVRVVLGPLHFALSCGLVDEALELIDHGARGDLQDSNGNLPLVYCHPRNEIYFYSEEYYPVIQSLLKLYPEFDEKLCLALSKRPFAELYVKKYNTDPMQDGANDFKKGYIEFIEAEHQVVLEAKEFNKRNKARIEAFKLATLNLNFVEMQKIYEEFSLENNAMKRTDSKLSDHCEREGYILRKKDLLDSFYSIEDSSDGLEILPFVLSKERYDIACWLIDRNHYYDLSEILRKQLIPDAKIKELAEFCFKKLIKKKSFDYIDWIVVSISPCLFYEIITLYDKVMRQDDYKIKCDSLKDRVYDRQAVLQIIADNIIHYSTCDEAEILKRIEFLIPLESSIINFISVECAKTLKDDQRSHKVKATCQAILHFIKQKFPEFKVEIEETEEPQNVTSDNNKQDVSQLVDRILYGQLPIELDEVGTKEDYLVEKISNQWDAFGNCPICIDDVEKLNDFISNIDVKPNLEVENLPSNVKIALQNLLVYGAKLLREEESSLKKSDLNIKITALSKFFETIFSQENLTASNIRVAYNTLEQNDVNRTTGCYRLYTWWLDKTFTNKEGKNRSVKSTMGELAYNLMWAVKNPDKDYLNEAEDVNSLEP